MRTAFPNSGQFSSITTRSADYSSLLNTIPFNIAILFFRSPPPSLSSPTATASPASTLITLEKEKKRKSSTWTLTAPLTLFVYYRHFLVFFPLHLKHIFPLFLSLIYLASFFFSFLWNFIEIVPAHCICLSDANYYDWLFFWPVPQSSLVI